MRWIVLAGAGSLILVLAGLAVIVQSRASSTWKEMESWMAARELAWETRDFSRPALWGETQPGSAFTHYREATRLSAELCRRRGEDELLRDVLLRLEDVPADEVDALRVRWASAVDAMRRGAHCDDARPPQRFEDGFDVQATNLLAGRWLCNVACFEARRLLMDGRGGDAVGITLDAATYGADLVGSPLIIDQMIGMALVAIATNEFWTAERLAELDDAALTLLADGFERLDAGLPVAMRLDGEALVLGHALTKASNLDEFELPDVSSWSYGFSSRWMIADAVGEIARSIDRLDRSADRRWPERERAIHAESEALSSSGNPIVRVSWPTLLSMESTLRLVAAQLRMLRVAIDRQLGRPTPQFEDPLGDGLLEVVESDDGARVVSDGFRGKDRLERALPAPR